MPPNTNPVPKRRKQASPRLRVNANRELITRFETKIQSTLARIWGEAAKALGVVQEADVPPSHEATVEAARDIIALRSPVGSNKFDI